MILEVAAARETAPGVRTLVLRAPGGGPLPAYPPGAHLVLDCGGVHNAYSLHGPVPPGERPREYHVSVLRVPDGRGGSSWLHRSARPGTRIGALQPRCTFGPAATARRHLLIAAGIGITPMLAHVRAARAWGRPFRLIYAHRPGSAAHLGVLRGLCGPRLRAVTGGRAELRAAAQAALRDQPLGTHAYVCGPPGMMDMVLGLAAAAGWPEERLHTERFTAPPGPREPFAARLARSGRTVPVGADESLLEALERAGLDVPHLCRRGVCGECRTPLSRTGAATSSTAGGDGAIDHRDLFLTPAERDDYLMPCVSRAAARHTLELDL